MPWLGELADSSPSLSGQGSGPARDLSGAHAGAPQRMRAVAARDGQQDTRLAAERGVKAAYAVKGHSCDEDADDSGAPPPAKPAPPAGPGQSSPQKPQ